jgi:hypothetical protein
MLDAVKPAIGQIVLLACLMLGSGGRVEAAFAVECSALTGEKAAGSLGVEFQMVLNGESPVEPDRGDLGAGRVPEGIPASPADTPFLPPQPLDLLVLGGSLSGAASSDSSSFGPGSATGLSCILHRGVEISGLVRSGHLFLVEERLNPPPFASRLFRPPRLV